MDFKRIVICKKLFVREKLSTVRELIYFYTFNCGRKILE